jgi:ATP-binding cassette subfamily C protein
MVLMSASSFTEGLSVVLLIPLLQLAGVDMQSGSLERISSHLKSGFSFVGVEPTLVAVLIAYVMITALQASFAYAQAIVNASVVQDYSHHLRSRLYNAIAQTEWLTLSRIRSSDFTFALTTAVDNVASAVQQLLFAGSTAAVALIYFVLSLVLSPVMTIVVSGAAVLLLLLQHAASLSASVPGEEVVHSTSDLYATAAEQLGGLKTAKSYGNENRHVEMFLAAARRLNNSSMRLVKSYAAFSWRQSVGAVTGLAVILFLSVRVFHLPAAGILLFLFLFSRIVPRLFSLQHAGQGIAGYLPALVAIESLIRSCEDSPEHRSAERISIKAGNIELRGVSFSYLESSNSEILAGVDLMLPSGKTSAIVGSSGAGKTTIADLLLGLIVPTKGQILIGGQPLDSSHLSSWRSQIGYVAQDTYLFNDSVRSNLFWAAPDSDEGDMWSALRAAAAHDFVARLPEGLDTVIGERGVRLSGGEKQRLSLARALLRRPEVLILDEATSALDSENEQRIYQAIERLRGEMTIVTITHRLATIRQADVICVIDQGRVAAVGTWDQLLQCDNPRFRELLAAQGFQSGSGSS